MRKETPRRGKAPGRGIENSVADTTNSKPLLARNQPHGLRDRLVGARRRLIERIAEDWSDDRRFPDTSWTRMLSDVQGAIAAVDDMMDEDGGAP